MKELSTLDLNKVVGGSWDAGGGGPSSYNFFNPNCNWRDFNRNITTNALAGGVIGGVVGGVVGGPAGIAPGVGMGVFTGGAHEAIRYGSNCYLDKQDRDRNTK